MNSRKNYPKLICVQRQSSSAPVKVGEIAGLSEEASELFMAASSWPVAKKKKHRHCLSNSITSCCTVVITCANGIWWMFMLFFFFLLGRVKGRYWPHCRRVHLQLVCSHQCACACVYLLWVLDPYACVAPKGILALKKKGRLCKFWFVSVLSASCRLGPLSLGNGLTKDVTRWLCTKQVSVVMPDGGKFFLYHIGITLLSALLAILYKSVWR